MQTIGWTTMNTRDFGTYAVRVIFVDGRGFIMEWKTGAHYGMGTGEIHPLTAHRFPSPYHCDTEIIAAIRYAFEEGNYSCDCNKEIFLAQAAQEEELEEYPCGDRLKLKKLVIIRSDGTAIEFHYPM